MAFRFSVSIMSLKYKRILLKLSGEALQGQSEFGIDFETISRICADVYDAAHSGVEVGIVIGGGNIFRGVSVASNGMNRATADYMGMLATVINALALQNGLEKLGLDTVVMSAISMQEVCQPYIRRKALSLLSRGSVVIFAAGSGNPFFTTDTAASLRAAELSCDVILKATKVDGVYSADPNKDKDATYYEKISYSDVIFKKLRVMDTSAVALAEESNIPIVVFSIYERGNLIKILNGEGHFTTVS